MRLLVLDEQQPMCCATCLFKAVASNPEALGFCTLYGRDLGPPELTRLVCWSYLRNPAEGDLWQRLNVRTDV